jgi:hypothetical protein
MAIVSSTYTLEVPQVDGRRWVREDHVDQIGKHWLIRYLAAVGADYATILANHATAQWAQIVNDEIMTALAVDADPVLVYATKTDFVPVLRAAYRTSSDVECGRLATWIVNRVNSGWVTEAQVQTAFGMTDPQYATFRAKIIALRTNYLAVQAGAGE